MSNFWFHPIFSAANFYELTLTDIVCFTHFKLISFNAFFILLKIKKKPKGFPMVARCMKVEYLKMGYMFCKMCYSVSVQLLR